MIAASPKVVAGILGHADTSITLNVYDHPEMEHFRDPLNGMAQCLLPTVTKEAAVTL